MRKAILLLERKLGDAFTERRQEYYRIIAKTARAPWSDQELAGTGLLRGEDAIPGKDENETADLGAGAVLHGLHALEEKGVALARVEFSAPFGAVASREDARSAAHRPDRQA